MIVRASVASRRGTTISPQAVVDQSRGTVP
jgi:hypothetical protein